MHAFLINNENITLILNGKQYTIPRTSPNAAKLITELRKPSPDEAALKTYADIATAMVVYSDGAIKITSDGKVSVDGEALPKVLEEKLFKCFKDNVPFVHLANCFKRLKANPSKRAVDELYEFLSRYDMPITPEGFFLGYKGVTSDYYDHHSRTFLNIPGKKYEMERNEVCDDASLGCSHGFHIGSFAYATKWATATGHVMICLIDPADVVSIPTDCAFQKLRTRAYKVLCESQGRIESEGVEDEEAPYEPRHTPDSGEAEDTNTVYIRFI